MTSAGGKLARDSFWMILVQVFGKGLALLFSLYAASALGVEKFGAYGYAIAIVAMVTAFSDFGTNTFLIRQTAVASDKSGRRRLLSASLTIKFALGLLGLLIIVFLSRILPVDRTVSFLLILFGLGMFFNNIGSGFSNTLIGLESFGLYGIISIFSQTINIGAACLLIYLGLGLIGIGYAFSGWGFLSFILISLIVMKRHYPPIFRISRKEIAKFIRGAAPLGFTAILVTIYYKSDYIILEYFKGTGEVGLYSAAYVVVNALIFLPTTISTTLLPKLSFLKENDPDKLKFIYQYVFKYLFFAGFGLGFGTLAVSSDLIAVIYPDDFARAYLALNILIWALALIFINAMQGNMLVALEKQRLLPYITGAAAAVNIGLNFILIPRYGIQGAALTTVLAEIVAGGSCLYILRNLNSPIYIIKVAYKTLTAGLSMYIVLLAIEYLSLFIRVPLGIGVYFIVLIILRGLTMTDLKPLKEMLKRG